MKENRRPGRRALLAAAAVLVGCGGSGPDTTAPAPPPPTRVERLLQHSRVSSIVTARARAFTRQVASTAGDLTDPELERLVPAATAAFDPDVLRRDVAGFIESEATDARLDEVLTWLDAGANAELAEITDDYEPPLTIDAYARSLLEEPPPDERVRLVVAWAEAQGAASFYVLLDEALNEAAQEVVRFFRPETPPFEPLEGDALQARLDDSFNAAVVSFLHRLEPVPDDVLRRATAEYATEAGQWYVVTYSLAVAEAMRAAGARTVARLDEGVSGW